MDNNALVSVIIPVYNGDQYLAEAIRSVLSQTYTPVEIIVVDDGSTDGTAGVAQKFFPLVTYAFMPHAGLAAARNRGVAVARGEYFAFLDADDLWMPDKLSLQLEAFSKDHDLDMVFGHVSHFFSPDLNSDTRKKIYCPPERMPGYAAGPLLIKRKAFSRIGLFETALKVGEFIEWLLRANEKGLKSFMLPDVVLQRRIHENNMGIRERDSRVDYVRIVKASLDRRRKSTQGKEHMKGLS